MLRKHQRKFIIIGVLLISLLITSLLSNKVFLADSPRIQPKFITSITNLPQTLANLTKGPNPQSVDDLFNMPVKQVSKGVYAGEMGTYKKYAINSDQVDWVEIKLTKKNGETVILRYPKDQPPPAQDMLQMIESE